MKVLCQKYLQIINFLFIIFIFGALSFGRTFSIVHINTPWAPIFITEIVLFFSLPVLIANFKCILNIPKLFLVFLLLYFTFGCFYLFTGVLAKNLFALRDVVLPGYILFLPLTIIFFTDRKKLKYWLFLLIVGDSIGIILGRFIVTDCSFFPILKHSMAETRTFNLGLCYGVSFAFLIAFFNFFDKKIYKIFISLLISLNFYMLLIIGKRTLWISLLAVILFFLFLFRKKFIKISFYVLPFFILLSTLLCFLDFKLVNIDRDSNLYSKAKSLMVFISNLEKHQKQWFFKQGHVDFPVDSLELSPKKRTKDEFGNIIWRLQVWKQAIKFGFTSPLFGKGYGNYPSYNILGSQTAPPGTIGVDSGVIPAHNHFVTVFYKMGFAGLFLFLFLNIYVFVYGIRYFKKLSSGFTRSFLAGVLGSLVVWQAMAFFFDLIESPPTSIFLWVLIGLVFSIGEIDRKIHE